MTRVHRHVTPCAAGYTIGYYGRPFEARNKASAWILDSCVLLPPRFKACRMLSLHMCMAFLYRSPPVLLPARSQPKGSSFNDDNKDFYRFVLGEGKVIPAFEEAVADMKVRRSL